MKNYVSLTYPAMVAAGLVTLWVSKSTTPETVDPGKALKRGGTMAESQVPVRTLPETAPPEIRAEPNASAIRTTSKKRAKSSPTTAPEPLSPTTAEAGQQIQPSTEPQHTQPRN
jgi:hypothetical protein